MEITENDNGEIKVNRNIDELEAIERIAFHEAAHAVIEFIFGYSITRVEIDPSEESGCCVYDHKSNVSREIIDLLNISEVDRRVMILCAGFACISILTHSKQSWHYSSDYTRAFDELNAIYHDKKVVNAHIRSNWYHVRNLLKQPLVWYLVEELHMELMWYERKEEPENWYGTDMADLLPEDFCEPDDSDQLPRYTDGKEVEQFLWHALKKYKQVHPAMIIPAIENSNSTVISETNAWELEVE